MSSSVEPITVAGASSRPASTSRGTRTAASCATARRAKPPPRPRITDGEPHGGRARPRARAVDEAAGQAPRRQRREQQPAGGRVPALVGERRQRDLHDADRDPERAEDREDGAHPRRRERAEPAGRVALAAPAPRGARSPRSRARRRRTIAAATRTAADGDASATSSATSTGAVTTATSNMIDTSA